MASLLGRASRRWDQRMGRNSMANQTEKLSRTILPIPDRQHVGLTTYDAKDPDTKFPPIEPLRPAKGAPNVLIVLLDDVGFAASSAPFFLPSSAALRAAADRPSESSRAPCSTFGFPTIVG